MAVEFWVRSRVDSLCGCLDSRSTTVDCWNSIFGVAEEMVIDFFAVVSFGLHRECEWIWLFGECKAIVELDFRELGRFKIDVRIWIWLIGSKV